MQIHKQYLAMKRNVNRADRANDGATAMAWRMSSYVKDASYIRAMVERDHGKAPTVSEIKGMIEWHINDREKFKRQAEHRDIGQKTLNDNGEPYQVPYIGPAPKPKREVKEYRRWDGGVSRITVEEVRANREPLPLADPFTAKHLIHSVAHAFGLTFDDVVGPSRAQKNVCARAVIAKLLHERNPKIFSYNRIAREIGRNDHSTVINLIDLWPERCKRVPAMLEVYWSLGGAE